jgi:phosphoserine phosphatase
MSEVYLINVTGKDRIGLLARFSGVLADHAVNVLDIGQAVIHDYISLGILVELPDEHQSSVLKDLLFAGHDLGLDVRFRPTSLDDYEVCAAAGGKERRVRCLRPQYRRDYTPIRQALAAQPGAPSQGMCGDDRAWSCRR